MIANSEFHVPILIPDKKYQTQIGMHAALHVEPSATVNELSGIVRGKNNVIYIEPHSHINRLHLTIDGDDNVVKFSRSVHIDNCTISIAGYTYSGNFQGNDNTLQIGMESIFSDVHIECHGSFNQLRVGARVYVGQKSELYLHGFGCSIRIGDMTSMTNAFIHAEEIESSIEIGEDNMLAAYVAISTSDKHPIYFIDSFQRENVARPIITGKHVWMASGVQCLKGARVGDYCIIGKHTSITEPILDPTSGDLAHHAIIYGMPAKVHKKGVTWSREMFFNLDDKISAKYPDAAAQTWFHHGHLLIRQGNEYLIKSFRNEAEKSYKQGVRAYECALYYKKNFVYAYSAIGIAYIHLSQIGLHIHDLKMATDSLESALSNFVNALKIDASHNDSIFYQQAVHCASESIKRCPQFDLTNFHVLNEMASVHLKMCSVEWYLFEREMAQQQYKLAQNYIKRASKKGSVPSHILEERDKIIKRYKTLMC